MIRLGLKHEPYWLDLLPGVRLKVRPFTTALFFAAQQAMAKEPVPDEPDLTDAIRGLAFIKALARLAVIEWEGVGDANGTPAAVTPPAVESLMDIWQAAASFERQYARPVAELDAEKNA
jgi:hypothetical protein